MRGASHCLHDTDPEPVRVDPPTPTRTYPIKWYRCRNCHQLFSERFPTVMIPGPS